MEMGSGDESNGIGMPDGTKTGKCLLWSNNEVFHINPMGCICKLKIEARYRKYFLLTGR
jgi:hypothetical protein